MVMALRAFAVAATCAVCCLGAGASESSAALEAEGLADDDSCGADDFECGLSLRQLRGEARAANVGAHVQEDLADAEVGRGGGDADGDLEAADCKVLAHYCSDFMTYGVEANCTADDACRVIGRDGDAEGAASKAWYCAPHAEECTQYLGLTPETFPPVNEPPQEAEEPGEEGAEDLGAASDAGWWHGPSMTLYHTTSIGAAHSIVHHGFRPGHGGWCGGAIYFIDQPYLPKTKYAPGITKSGVILQAKVRMGRMATHFNRHCKGYGGTGVYAAKHAGYNSVEFNPGDGNEFIIWDRRQVSSVRIYKYM